MSTRFKIVCGVTFLLSLLFIGGTLASNTVSASKAPKVISSSPQPPGPNLSQTYPTGASAIPIRQSGITTNTASNASTPAFTKEDVIAFINQHGFAGGPVVKGAHLKILSIQFVTAAQATKLMDGENADRPDNYLVCYVKVQGPFQPQNVEAPRGAKLSPFTFGDMEFDAHTGNLLIWGAS